MELPFVEGGAPYDGLVELEITRVKHITFRRLDKESDRLRRRMAHPKRRDADRPFLYRLAGGNGINIRPLRRIDPGITELLFKPFCGIRRRINFGKLVSHEHQKR